jgi:hypothetical protein
MNLQVVNAPMLGNLHGSSKTVIDRLENRRVVVMDAMNFWMDIAMDDLKAV